MSQPSAWGKAWGNSWGVAWGFVEAQAQQDEPVKSPFGKHRRAKRIIRPAIDPIDAVNLDEEDELALSLLGML